jgi:GNAT superfamily N-acetyltransferase
MNIESIQRNKLLDTEPALTARLRELTLALDSDMSWFLDAAEDQEGFAIVAREDDVVVGWATVQWVRIERRYLDVFVDEAHRGKGHARALARWAFEFWPYHRFIVGSVPFWEHLCPDAESSKGKYARGVVLYTQPTAKLPLAVTRRLTP